MQFDDLLIVSTDIVARNFLFIIIYLLNIKRWVQMSRLKVVSAVTKVFE